MQFDNANKYTLLFNFALFNCRKLMLYCSTAFDFNVSSFNTKYDFHNNEFNANIL